MLILLIGMAVIYDLLSGSESQPGSVLRSKLTESVTRKDRGSFGPEPNFGLAVGNN